MFKKNIIPGNIPIWRLKTNCWKNGTVFVREKTLQKPYQFSERTYRLPKNDTSKGSREIPQKMLFQPESGPHKRCFYKPIELQMSIHQRPRIYIYIFEANNPDVPWWYQLYTPQKDQDVVQRGTPKKIKTMSFWRNHGHMWYPKFGKHPCRCSILFPVSISPAQQIAAHRYSQYLCHQLRIGTRNQVKRNPYKVVPRKYKWRQMDVFFPSRIR
jgi:hypothetical protein